MSYSFDLLGITPILKFFEHQQRIEQNPYRGQAYLASFECSLDALIQSTQTVACKPDWNWDEVVQTMIDFWLKQEDKVKYWQHQLEIVGRDNIIVAKVFNFEALRTELELIFDF